MGDYMSEITEDTIDRFRSKTCGKGFCESNAFKIEIRRLTRQLEQKEIELQGYKEVIKRLSKIRLLDTYNTDEVVSLREALAKLGGGGE